MSLAQPRKLECDDLREYAVKLLRGRALTVSEFKDKLLRRAADPGDIEGIMAQLKEYGALNDRRYAEHFAETRAGSGNYGRQRVVSDLLRKKVAPKLVEKATSDAFSGTNEAEMVQQWLARKYRGKDLGTLLLQPSKLVSVFRRLRLAGFSSGPSIQVLKRFAAEAERLEGLDEES